MRAMKKVMKRASAPAGPAVKECDEGILQRQYQSAIFFFVKFFECSISDRMLTRPSMVSISSLENNRAFSCCATCVCCHERNPVCCVVVLLSMVQNRVTAECEEQERIFSIFWRYFQTADQTPIECHQFSTTLHVKSVYVIQCFFLDLSRRSVHMNC